MAAGLHIIGQGLAGTILAWRCLQAGVPFTIRDQQRAFTASKVAAGLVTPVTGQRLARTVGWQWQPEMVTFYRWVEGELSQSFYEARPMLRVLASEEERKVVEKRLKDPDYVPLLGEITDPLDDSVMRMPFGSVTMPDAGQLRVPEFLAASRLHFQSLGCWLGESIDGQQWPTDRQVVLCQGPWLCDQALFDWLPMRYSHGDILTLSIPALDRLPGARDRLYARQCWLLPDGNDRWCAGSTYVGVGKPTTEPFPEGRNHLETLLGEWLACDFEVIDHVAAVRPVTLTRHPILGRHPAHPHLAVFGGLGSKGVLIAPHYASVLLQHLLNGAELPREVDIAIQ